jgi:hypothetical protein
VPVKWKAEHTHVKSRLAHHKVIKKNPASARQAIFEAFSLKPQAIKHAPMKDEPRYPAGKVIQGIPPLMLVAPPSSAASLTSLISTVLVEYSSSTYDQALLSALSHKSGYMRTHGSSKVACHISCLVASFEANKPHGSQQSKAFAFDYKIRAKYTEKVGI